jgi:hypothetical protein
MGIRTFAALLVVLMLGPGFMVGYAVVTRTAPAISAARSARARAVLEVVAGTVSTPPTLAATDERREPDTTESEKPAVVLAVRVPGSTVVDIDGPAANAPDTVATVQSR